MRKAILALFGAGALAAAATTILTTPAQAWGGCGPGWRPTPYGCRPIHHRYWGGPAFVVGPAWGYGYGPRWHHRHYWRRDYW